MDGAPIASFKDMRNLTLAPEEDDSDFPGGHNVGPSPNDADNSKPRTELQRLRFQFNPHKVGFGLLPWPGVDPSGRSQDTVVIAMKYLMDGKSDRNREGKK